MPHITDVMLDFQEVQLRDQGEGIEMALSKGWALPPAGQRRDHRAALPGHSQYELSEQGQVTGFGQFNLHQTLLRWRLLGNDQLNTSKWSDMSTEYWFDVALQGVGVFGWLVVGEGLPTVRVLPVQHCQKHCSSFNLWLTPGDMGRDASTPRYGYLNLSTRRHQVFNERTTQQYAITWIYFFHKYSVIRKIFFV